MNSKETKSLEDTIDYLQELNDVLEYGIQWCSGSADFQPKGKARKGWLKLQKDIAAVKAKEPK